MSTDARKVKQGASWLADEIGGLKKRMAGVEGKSDLAYSSIEDGAIAERDLDGNLVSSVGKQFDGSHVAVPYMGPTPAVPVAPSLKALPGMVEVRWSGKFTGDAVSSMDFKHVAVHVSLTPEVDTTPSTQVATIRGELGDVATVTADEGMIYVALVAWTAAGKASDPSPVAAVAVPLPPDVEAIQGAIDATVPRFSTSAPTGADTAARGALWFQINATNQVLGQWQQTAPGIAATWTARAIQGTALAADAIDGKVITGATVRTAASGPRVEMNKGTGELVGALPAGVHAFGAPGTAGANGDMTVSLTAESSAGMEGQTNSIPGLTYRHSYSAQDFSLAGIKSSDGRDISMGAARTTNLLFPGSAAAYIRCTGTTVRISAGSGLDFESRYDTKGAITGLNTINGDAVKSDWVKLANASGWSDYVGGGGYRGGIWARLLMGNVQIAGMVKSGTDVMATLPTNMRPAYSAMYPAIANGGACGVTVKNDGQIAYLYGPAAPGYVNITLTIPLS